MTALSWKLGGEVAAVGFGQAIAVAGAIAGVRLLTEFLDPVSYGELALGMSASMLALQVVLGPVNVAASRFFAPALEAGELRGYLAGLRRLMFWSFLALAVLALVAGVSALVVQRHALPLVVASFAFAFASGATAILGGVQNAARQRVIAAAHEGVSPWLRVGGAILLMHLFVSHTSGVAMAAYAIATALVAFSQFRFFRGRILPLAAQETAVPGERWYGQMKSYGWPFVTWGAFSWAQMVSDRWALELFAGTHQVGLYTVLYQLGFYPLMMLSTLIVQVAAPVLYERAGDATDPVRLRNAFRLNARLAMATLGATAAGALIAAVLHPYIGRLLLAESYRGITHLFPWMLLAGGLFATGQVISLLFMLANRSRLMIAPKIVTAIAGVVLNVLGARYYGTPGVIGANISFSFVYCVWMTVLAMRSFGRGAA